MRPQDLAPLRSDVLDILGRVTALTRAVEMLSADLRRLAAELDSNPRRPGDSDAGGREQPDPRPRPPACPCDASSRGGPSSS